MKDLTWRKMAEKTTDNAQPDWDGGIPFCAESCPRHDGKRCEILGTLPSLICGPCVNGMAHVLNALTGEKP